MIATQTQPNLTLYSWDVSEGMAVLRCRSEDGIGDVALGFTSLAELESFATAAAQMAQDYWLSKGTKCEACEASIDLPGLCALCRAERDPKNPAPLSTDPDAAIAAEFHKAARAGKPLVVELAPPMSEVDRLLVEAVVTSRPEPVDYAARNLAICNEARAKVGNPPLTPEEYAALPF